MSCRRAPAPKSTTEHPSHNKPVSRLDLILRIGKHHAQTAVAGSCGCDSCTSRSRSRSNRKDDSFSETLSEGELIERIVAKFDSDNNTQNSQIVLKKKWLDGMIVHSTNKDEQLDPTVFIKHSEALHVLGWYYRMLVSCYQKPQENNPKFDEQKLLSLGMDEVRELSNTTRSVEAGTYNAYLTIDSSNTVTNPIFNFIKYVYKFKEEEYNGTTQGHGRLPYGIGVRVSKTGIPKNDTSTTNAFRELNIATMLGMEDLAPPMLAALVLQSRFKPIGAKTTLETDGTYNLVTFYKNAQSDLDKIFRQIESKSCEWVMKNQEEWLKKLGEAIVMTIKGVSQKGFVLFDNKPHNMLYVGTKTDSPSTDELLCTTPKVWATDFDSGHTIEVSSESDNFDCVEMINLLMFLNFVHCNYSKSFTKCDETRCFRKTPIGEIVMEPLRARLRELGDPQKKYDGQSNLNDTIKSSDLCTFLTLNGTHVLNLKEVTIKKLEYVEARLATNVYHYANPNDVDLGCYPYRRDLPLISQMYKYLSEWNVPSGDNQKGKSIHFPSPKHKPPSNR